MKHKRSMVAVIMAGLLCLGWGVGFAQRSDFGGPGPEPPGPEGAAAREILQNLKIWHLTERLEITPEQGARIFPLIQSMEKLHQKERQENRDIYEQLSAILGTPESAERTKKLEALVEESIQAQVSHRQEQENARKALYEVLTIEQQAKFIVFQEEFPRYVRKTMGKMRNMRGGQRGGRRRNHEVDQD